MRNLRIISSSSEITPTVGYFIQNENEDGIIGWWDNDETEWVTDPFNATIYLGLDRVEEKIEDLKDVLDPVEWYSMRPVESDPIIDKHQEFREDPPIKYIEKQKKAKISNSKITAGTVLLDLSCEIPQPFLITKVTDRGSAFSVSAEFPSWTSFDSVEDLVKGINSGRFHVIWQPEAQQDLADSLGESESPVVVGTILLSTESVDFENKKPFMVNKISGNNVHLCHPGEKSDLVLPIEHVANDIADGIWEVVYDPRDSH